ncbi:MAG: FapA family protein [Bdellovibrionota bacterium]|nr:MAG: FapA family protein [Bdellovibrionota bacterium]
MQQVFTQKHEALTLVGKVEEDRLKLFVDCTLEAPVAITRDQFVALLPNTIPADFIHHQVIDDICAALAKGEKVEARRVAKGVASEDGADGKLVLLVKKFSTDAEIKEDERGWVNYRELHLFENIRVDQAVARVYPPKPGKDGTDVLGKRIAAKPGKPFKFSGDQSLKVEEAREEGSSYQVVKAVKAGMLVEDNGRYQIKEELVLPKGVDAHVGNIDFIGKVIVRGDVAPGFQIKSVKGIEISGNVNSAVLITSDGDILVKGFIHGGEQGRVVCGGSFSAAVAHNLRVDAKGDVVIIKEAVDCQFQTTAAVRSPRAQIVGGSAKVVDGIEGKRLGNDAGKPTHIELCSDQEASPEFAKLILDIQNHEKALSVLKVHLGPYTENPARIALLKSPLREKMEELLRKYRTIDESRNKLLGRRKVMLEGALFIPVVRVNAQEFFFSGVRVKADEEVYVFNDVLKGPKTLEFSRETKKFELVEIRPLESSSPPKEQDTKKK